MKYPPKYLLSMHVSLNNLKSKYLIVILRLTMGVTRTDIYTNEHNQLAVMLKAIAHPARMAILEHIIKANACICGDLVDELGLAQATISQHLKELKNAGLIKGTIEGTSICYCIEAEAWTLLRTNITTFLNSYTELKGCC